MPFSQILRHFRSARNAIVASTVVTAVGVLCEAVALVLVVALAEAISTGHDRFTKSLGPVSVDVSRSSLTWLALVAVAASMVLALVANTIRSRAIARWSRGKRLQVVHGFLEASWEVQAAERSGHLQTVAGYVVQSTLVLVNIANAARGLTGVLMLLGTALVVSLTAAVAIVVLGGVLFFVLRPLARQVKARSRQQALLTAETNQELGELAELARDITVFGVGHEFERRADRLVDGLAAAETRLGELAGAVSPVYQGIALLAVVGALGIAAGATSVDVAALGAVALLVLRSVSYGQQLQAGYQGVQTGAPALELLEESLDHLRHHRADDGQAELGPVEAVALEGVSFAYGDGEPALTGVDLRFTQGEIVGVVGPSGAGKSTLAQLLLRLRQPSAGEVLANGRPAAAYDRRSWSRQVALVAQEPKLVHGTVSDNIAFFRPGVTAEAVEAAARAAGIHDVISGLDEGYATPIGRSLRNLSGGQVQRIGIARALAGQPSMLVLDEPTSALDQQSEALVQATLESLRGRMLVVIIAHRLSTLSICDRVVVMADGAVEADGTVAEALEASSFFRQALERSSLTEPQA